MRTTLALGLALLLVALPLALAPTALAAPPCVVGQEDNCIVQTVTCVRHPCPPRIPLLEWLLRLVDDQVPGYCEPPFDCPPA